MNKLFLIIPVLLFLLIQVPNKAESSFIPPSHYIVTFEDDSGMKIEPPIWIDMLIKYDDKILDNYTAKVFRNPGVVYTSAWYVPNYEEGTTLEIIASKEGYLQSQPHIYTITKDSPFTGIVFEHVFQLTSKHMPLKTAPKQIPYTININNTHYQIFTQTDQELQKIYYDEEFNGIILHIIGDDYYGNTINLIIPKEMMNGRFDMFNFKINAWHPEIIDGELGQVIGHIVTKSENSTNLTVYFGKGENNLGIKATHVVPEFSTSQTIIAIGLIIMIVILGIVFTKRKTNLQIPEITSK